MVRLDAERVDRHVVVDAEDPGHDVALRVDGGLLGAEAALADEVGDQAVVDGELVELAAGVAVDPGVADVGDGQQLVAVVIDDGEGHDRGAHAGQLGVAGPGLVDGPVGLLDRVDEPVDGVLVEGPGDGVAGDLGGDLAAPVAAHAVGDGPQAHVVAGDELVLVAGADAPDVGGAAPAQPRAAGAGGHTSSSTVLPICSLSRRLITIGPATRRRLR